MHIIRLVTYRMDILIKCLNYISITTSVLKITCVLWPSYVRQIGFSRYNVKGKIRINNNWHLIVEIRKEKVE